MKIVKVPTPTRIICGSLVAYWLSGIVSPAFVAIAVLILFFIPVFIPDYFSNIEISEESDPPKKQKGKSSKKRR